MKLLVGLLVLELVSRLFVRSSRSVQSTYGRRNIQSDVQPCKHGSTCVVWEVCSTSSLPADAYEVSCHPEGYSKWDRGVCCIDLKEDPISGSDVGLTQPISSTTTSTKSPVEPTFDCGRSNSTPGSKGPGNWPWLAAIRKTESNGLEKFVCDGFLIDQNHILTAAHCFLDRNMTGYTVRIGIIDTGDVYYFKKLVIPASYRTLNKDIAVATLDRTVTMPNFMPVCLPDSLLEDLTGLKATSASWGTRKKDGVTSYFLRELHGIPIMSNERCESLLRRGTVDFNKTFPLGITPDYICTEEPKERDAVEGCAGGSGAPLMIYKGGRWYAIGMFIFGTVRCGFGFPEGYTRISSFKEFIQNNLKGHSD